LRLQRRSGSSTENAANTAEPLISVVSPVLDVANETAAERKVFAVKSGDKFAFGAVWSVREILNVRPGGYVRCSADLLLR